MFDSNLKTQSHALQTSRPLGLSVVISTMAMMLVLLIGGAPLTAQDGSASKVIPTKAQFRDVSTDNLSGEARRAAITQNSKARKNRNEARLAAREGIASGDMAPVKEFFNGYVFPKMTQPEELKESGALRDSFFRTYMKPEVNESSRKQLISAVILPAMQAIATGKEYAPSARLNAVALIGRLDESALVRTGSRVRPPRPSSTGFQFLSGLLNDANSPPWLKAAAVQGLVRHLQVDQAVDGRLLNDQQRNRLETFATNTLDGKNAGQAEWSADLDYWLKRRSVQLLGAIGRPGSGGSVIDRLVAIAGDETQTTWMQLDAVKSLRTIDFTGVQEAQVSKVMLTLTNFVQRHLSQEDQTIASLLEDLIYKNILYGDTDLAASGTNYKKNVATGSTAGFGFRRDDDDAIEEMRAGSAARGGGSTAKEMGGSSGKGMGGSSGKEMSEPTAIVELPNYQLNLIRRRIKIYAFTANDVIQNATGLEAAASAKDKQLRVELARFTKDFLTASDVGLIDVNRDIEEVEFQTESFTSQLQGVCRNGASALKIALTRHAGGGPQGGGSDTKEKPASALPF